MLMPAAITRWAITVVAVSMSVFHLYVAFVGPPDAYVMRGIHVAFALVLAFLILPGWSAKAERPGIVDVVLLAAAAVCALYPMWNLQYITTRMYYVHDPILLDYIFGIGLIVLIMEATRRATGWALPITAALFLLYGLTWGNQSVGIMLDQLYLTTEGIFGIPLYVSATYVMLFILFGAFVERSGAGQMFMDFALALAGHTSGGPAKVAIITSSLFGTVSGSAVANVMTTGTFTIPLMKRTGYRPAFAGAVEAVASTGGQLMPPIMGAAAFVMAEFLGTSYLTVAAFAILPALLYYVAVFMAVHFEARRVGLVGLPRADLPRLKEVLLERGHLFLPLAVIIGVLLTGYSAAFAAICGIASVIPTTWLRASTRWTFTPMAIIEALEAGARNTIVVALACACAGIVIGTITLTGLGLAFTNVVLTLSQNMLMPALILTMVAGIILGMGLPTTPAYIVQVALLVPALVRLGVQVEAAHSSSSTSPCSPPSRRPSPWRSMPPTASPGGPDGEQLGGGEAGPHGLHHPLHVRLRPLAAADRRVAADPAHHRHRHGRRHLPCLGPAQLLLLGQDADLGTGTLAGRRLRPDQARALDRHHRCDPGRPRRRQPAADQAGGGRRHGSGGAHAGRVSRHPASGAVMRRGVPGGTSGRRRR
jgi:TRAP transporter 4TM/12TM fusion protein